MDQGDGVEASSDLPGPIVVGMGASAGGLDALQRFFDHMPADHDLAFVVVMHRSSGHANLLPDLLARHTSMPMVDASDGLAIAPRTVYIAPPGSLLDIADGHLRVTCPAQGVSHTIDHFFRSLARDQRERAIGIVLSGAGSDGTLGLEEIKAASGMVMVQDEASAGCAGMPHSAIATALVDYVLPVEECPQRLLAHVRSPLHFPDVRRGDGLTAEVLTQVVGLLRARSGHDFSRYKTSALQRRIERRMMVRGIDSPHLYRRLLESGPEEVDALFHEVLIGVTSFFRDPEAFDALGSALDPLLAERHPDDTVRVWVAGCATGEEAYSVAIALRESAARTKSSARFRVFATDIDDRAIGEARSGLFPESIADVLSAERLERFFVSQQHGFRIKREIRDLLVFAEHNLLVNPPFSRLDLICCRNVLIYFEPGAQEETVSFLEYALRPGGLLMLGSSEGLGPRAQAFDRVDATWKLFRRGSAPVPWVAPPARPRRATRPRARMPQTAERAGRVPSDLVDQLLLEQLVPPSVLVDQRGGILHVHGETGRFLEPAATRAGIVHLAQVTLPDLDMYVGSAIGQAIESGHALHRNVRVSTAEGPIHVDLRARRVESPEPLAGLVLITFEAAVRQDERKSGKVNAPEELQLTNEVLRSNNEELRATNEELETSREELYSLNEELHSVNAEMHSRLADLSHSSDDMLNLLNSTDVAVLFLDAELKVMRYTMQATKVFNLIPSDVGRPIDDLVCKLDYVGMADDAREVLRTRVYRHMNVRDREGGRYVMRIAPYRTDEEHVSGLVITFLDVTRVQRPQDLEGGLLSALERLPLFILGQDRALRVLWAHAPALGLDAASLAGRSEEDLLPHEQAEMVSAMKRQVIETGASFHAEVEMTLPVRGRTVQELWVEPIRDATGAVTGVLSLALDVTRMKRGEQLLSEVRAELAATRAASKPTRPEA